MTFEVVVRNPLVAHVWRLMPGWNVYRHWYLGVGAFVRKNPDLRGYVRSYVETQDASAAIANLFSATEMLLRRGMKTEGVRGPILNDTLPNLLGYCTSANQRFLNLPGMCCDPRSIFRLNVIRKGVEHGDYRYDQVELSRSGWNPADPDDPDPHYLKIIDNRLLTPHLQLCGIFNQVDSETGHFIKMWEPRGFADCRTKFHDQNGRLTDEPASPLVSSVPV